MLLIENVKGIIVGHGESKVPFAEKIKRGLDRLGYVTAAGIHRASEFGVPQERPRYVILGVDGKRFPNFVNGDLGTKAEEAISRGRIELLMEKGLDAEGVVSVRDAICDLEINGSALEICPDAKDRLQLSYEQPSKLTPYQESLRRNPPRVMNSMRLARHSEKVTKRLEALIRWCKTKNRRGVTLRPQERKSMRSKKHSLVVLNPNKPSHTLTTLPDDLIHYNEPRILTVREYARLQSFPDWFVFLGKYTTGGENRKKECPRFTQVGNAVAPFVAEALGKALALLSGARNAK
jgi:DNA (cytosine-5)-methyltransferase 1